MRLRKVLLVLLSLVAGACVATDTGNPSASVNLDALLPPQVGVASFPDPFVVEAAAGTANPAEGEIVFRIAAPGGEDVRVNVEADGRFAAAIPIAEMGSLVQLEHRYVGGPGEVALLTMTYEEDVRVAAELAGCIQIPRYIDSTEGGIVELQIENTCSEEVRFGAARVRGESGARVDDAPTALPAGESGRITLNLQAGADDILLIPIAAPQVDQRVVSIYPAL